MKMTLVGFKVMEFKNDAGDKVRGTSLFTNYPMKDTIGVEVKKFFVSEENKELIAVDLTKCVGKVLDFDLGLNSKLLGVTLA